MLDNPIMGVLALAIVWVNTLLVAAAALRELGPIRAVRRRPMARVTIERGAGPGGAFAVHRVEQVGRATDSGDIVFGDRSYAGEIFGGVVIDADGNQVEVAAAQDGEVWLSDGDVAAAAACPSAQAFAAAFETARKARGHTRSVEATLEPGAVVHTQLAPTRPEQGLSRIVSSVDPARWASRAARLVWAFVVAELAIAAGCTAVALVPPAFGTVSKIGGGLCLAFFLLVQPAGTALRDALRPPSRKLLRGRWSRTVSSSGGLEMDARLG